MDRLSRFEWTEKVGSVPIGHLKPSTDKCSSFCSPELISMSCADIRESSIVKLRMKDAEGERSRKL